MLKNLMFVGIALLLTGCASKLTTFDSSGKESVGIPVARPVLIEATYITEYKVAPGSEHAPYATYCTCEEDSKYEFLPLGETHYIAFAPSPFAKGEFKLEFSDSGNLKIVSLNSEASSGVDSVKGLLETVLPFVKAPKVAPSAERLAVTDVAASDLKKLHCLKVGTKLKSIKRVQIQP